MSPSMGYCWSKTAPTQLKVVSGWMRTNAMRSTPMARHPEQKVAQGSLSSLAAFSPGADFRLPPIGISL